MGGGKSLGGAVEIGAGASCQKRAVALKHVRVPATAARALRDGRQGTRADAAAAACGYVRGHGGRCLALRSSKILASPPSSSEEEEAAPTVSSDRTH
jgi:hypothetical protein